MGTGETSAPIFTHVQVGVDVSLASPDKHGAKQQPLKKTHSVKSQK